jgi:ubiquinone/menaquinone biosynthesis C-methylase UbiE
MSKVSTKHSSRSTNRSPKTAQRARSQTKTSAAAVADRPADGKKQSNNGAITADQYNDPNHNYLHYWDGRDYEDAAERLAISRLLKGKRFRHAVDIGGGYGRLCIFLENYADHVTLTDPSQQQLDIGKEYLKDHPEIDRKLMQADHLDFKDGSIDLFTIVRILHHIPEPSKEFAEIARVLSDDGYFLMEFANYTHFRNRLKYLLKGKKLPAEPVDIRSARNIKPSELPFVNHNPRTVIQQLKAAGLEVEKTLSVSNLRSPGLKKVLPRAVMMTVEKALQQPLAGTYFGPSIFFLIRKTKA